MQPANILSFLLAFVWARSAWPFCEAFAPRPNSAPRSRLHSSSNSNPNAPPELPAIPGDFDWDSKYAGDVDWLMGDAVPGKRVLSELELASQVTALGALEEKWRRERQAEEYNDARQIGWVPKAEIFNGRTAMFFLVTGLLTEYWTGISIPGQVEEMLRIAGVIGM
jgi:hypothetical protein